jgi:hypothetical protein
MAKLDLFMNALCEVGHLHENMFDMSGGGDIVKLTELRPPSRLMKPQT